MHALLEGTIEKIVSGLRRKAITKCSEWALAYRVMGQPIPGPWSFKYHPWVRDIHDCDAEMVVGQKGAQLAFTETALNKVFYAIDIHGLSVLYVLPTLNPDASNFSQSRFSPALELSPHLRNLFSDVQNIGHKRAGSANLYIRGSRSRSQLKSIPVGLAILDEVDEMVEENIPLVFERMAGHLTKQSYLLSTPTIEGHGINKYFAQSSQNYFYFRCPSCNKYTTLVYPECLVITAESLTDSRISESHLICRECHAILPHESKTEWLAEGKWIPTHSDRPIAGFHISQLYSCTVSPPDLAASCIRGRYNPADEQEFYNSKLGLTHAVKGAKITDEVLDSCITNYKKADSRAPGAIVTMGIDVGTFLHCEITEHFLAGKPTSSDVNLVVTSKVLLDTKVKDFTELDNLMKSYSVLFAVIDANPERRMALEFAQRFWGRVKLCFYGNNVNGKQIHVHDEGEHTVTVDRTSWMDLALARFKTGKIQLPVDISTEYRDHIKMPVRRYEKDMAGNLVGRYISVGDDHYAHARTYSELALKLCASVLNNEPITKGVL